MSSYQIRRIWSSPVRLHSFLPLPGLNQLDLTFVSRMDGPVREGGDAPKPEAAYPRTSIEGRTDGLTDGLTSN